MQANIKIWVLTGDKQGQAQVYEFLHVPYVHFSIETAINIGYSSKLLVEEMRVFIINAEDKAAVEKQLIDARYYRIGACAYFHSANGA